MAVTLEMIRSGKQKRPPRIMLHGDPGVGKSTFASGAPDPIFILAEDGVGEIDTNSFPLAQSFDEIMEAIKLLYTTEHEYKTVVIDSVDAIEPMIWDAVCKEHKAKSIEVVLGGYSKGYREALTHWKKFLDGLDALRNDVGMNVIMIAHSAIQHVTPPDTEGYDRRAPKLHKWAVALMEERVDIIGYASEKVLVSVQTGEFGKKHKRAKTTGERLLHVGKNPAYVSKTRYNTSPVLPLEWSELEKEINNG